jgi:RNA polymerase sigma factor (sigma-70 family)
MPGEINEVVEHLRRAVLRQDQAGLSDGQLLGHFIDRRDGAAVAELVRRHGPMVWGICRRVLQNHHEAEDAFQATFLVLVRRAASITPRDMVGNWLYGVAHQTAVKARTMLAKRRTRERQGTAVPEPQAPEQDAWDDLQLVLDQELSRLPDKFRVAIVLCDLEGKTRKEAARQLGLPEGTVAGRLTRGRALLAKRLTRHGLALTGAALATVLTQRAASASVPPSVMSSALQAITGVAAGQAATAGVISGNVAALAEGVLKAMFVNRLKKMATVLVVLGVLGLGGRWGAEAGLAAIGHGPATARPAAAAVPPQAQRGADGPLLAAGPEPRAAGQAPPPGSPPARPVDREAWARKLASLNDANWRRAFAVGEELAALPADEGFAILKENWKKIGKVEARQQLLKAWDFARHPRLVDGLDLGMRDPSPEVQSWAITYLNDLAFQDFSEDFQAYKDWYQANHDKPLSEVVARSARRFATEAAGVEKGDVDKRARWLARHTNILQEMPEARQAMLDAGMVPTLERWASGATTQSPREEIERVTNAVSVIGQLKPGKAVLKRVVVPLLAKEKPVEVRAAAIRALEGGQNAWAIDLLLDVLKESLEEEKDSRQLIPWTAADTLASMDNPRVIPTMIAVIDADNTYDTVYGVGYFGLGRLTGVEYHESHDGAWWRRWWEKNTQRYPEAVQALEIPNLKKRQGAEDIPAQDLRAGGDANKRYFLIGAKDVEPPAAGYGLLIVLPGGAGGADFQPFIREIYRKLHKDVLHDRWLIAQAVAPEWDKKQFERLVWPTATSGYPTAKFTTEEFIEAIVNDVRAKVKIDPRRVFLLGWSSGGPPCYAAALREDSVVTGAFIAMSVFRPGQLPALENARGRAFYLLQSPEDDVTVFHHAEAAETALRAAGAKVRLQRYEGGHRWHGDVPKMIGDGITWLDQQAGGK